jgi:hypothetical protein
MKGSISPSPPSSTAFFEASLRRRIRSTADKKSPAPPPDCGRSVDPAGVSSAVSSSVLPAVDCPATGIAFSLIGAAVLVFWLEGLKGRPEGRVGCRSCPLVLLVRKRPAKAVLHKASYGALSLTHSLSCVQVMRKTPLFAY